MEFLNTTNYDEGEDLDLHESMNNIIVFKKILPTIVISLKQWYYH